MAFTAKRGRPRTKPIGRILDLGTEQLQAKRRQQITIEPLDLLEQKSLITKDQHWAGIHLRWLYTLKMGAPNISASNLDEFYGNEVRIEDEDWRINRVTEYNMAVELLRAGGCLKNVMDVAIFGMQKFPLKIEDLQKIREGLSHLCKVWKKKQQ